MKRTRKNLKIRHNRVTGFYIEVSKGQLDLVPEDYERRQTLVNAERFVTPELKQREQKIFGATDRAHALEYELFKALRIEIAEKTGATLTFIEDVFEGTKDADVIYISSDEDIVKVDANGNLIEVANDVKEIIDKGDITIKKLN